MSMLLKGNSAEISLRILRWEIISVDPMSRLNVNRKISVKEMQGDKNSSRKCDKRKRNKRLEPCGEGDMLITIGSYKQEGRLSPRVSRWSRTAKTLESEGLLASRIMRE